MSHNRGVSVRPNPTPTPPLGARLIDGRLEVTTAASHADGVDLCLIDVAEDGSLSERRFPMSGPSRGRWTVTVHDVHPGQRYGFRVTGPWRPQDGLMHNPAKLLVDPYARGIVGDIAQHDAIFPHVDGTSSEANPYGDINPEDSAPYVPHGVVVADPEYRERPARPTTPWEKTVIYEAHVKGLTKLCDDIPEELRGTYAGAAHPRIISHLRDLGVTAIELLPIHSFVSEQHLLGNGLTNYWGYNTLGFFAPHAAYATAAAQAAGAGAVRDEVIAMVDAFHEAGIEVILDVVYNHTCEEGLGGPSLSWRGLDNTSYYLHDGSYPARPANLTGTGNSLDFRHNQVVGMTLDSLRYWSEVIGVDGFRFDLAVTLGRHNDGFTPAHGFLTACVTDPVLSGRKLIAEPWDVGPGGWQTGGFPDPFSEWNDKFRDTVRGFWLSDADAQSKGEQGHPVADLATRLAGSADVFGHTDPPLSRGQIASVNYVTSHDGFTLLDLVRYSRKHNEANGENNRDGTDNNRSWNHGIEGPILRDEIGYEISPMRRRSLRNLLASLVLSDGVAMLTGGDEMGRTQQGNNNAYCQDNELSWMSWDLAPWKRDLYSMTAHLIRLRHEHPALHQAGYALARPYPDQEIADLTWYNHEGPMRPENWSDPGNRTLQMLRAAPHSGARPVLMVLHGGLEPQIITLPQAGSSNWDLVWDSTWETPEEGPEVSTAEELYVPAGGQANIDELTVQVYLGDPLP